MRKRLAPLTAALATLALLLPGQGGAVLAAAEQSHRVVESVRGPTVSRAGVPLWVARFQHGDLNYDLAVSSDGSRVFATGERCGGFINCLDDDFETVAYDAHTGSHVWVAAYDSGTGDEHDIPYVLGVSTDGQRVFVSGGSAGADPQDVAATVAYDASTGAQLWVARGNGSISLPEALVVSPDGSAVYVSGGNFVGSDFDYATVAYDAVTGSQLWVAAYEGPSGEEDLVHDMRISPDEDVVFVTGESVGNLYNDWATIAYDAATGSALWVTRYDTGGGKGDTAYALAVAPDGSRVYSALDVGSPAPLFAR